MVTGMQLIDEIRAERAAPPSGIRTLGLDSTHRWIRHLEPGRVELEWPIDRSHDNLEGAVICSWTAAVADQAIFFAGTSVCAEGEGTRMVDLRLTCHRNIVDGPVSVVATVDDRVDGRLHASCRFVLPTGELAASVAATLDVIAA